MGIKCVIIDDEPLGIQVLERHMEQLPDIELVATFQNPVDALEFLKTQTVELIFLDIEMPLLSGIDFIQTIPTPIHTIFTTAYRNYAIESYELGVVDYLLKPISFARFLKSVQKFKSRVDLPFSEGIPSESNLRNDHIYVNANKKFIKIRFEDIQYVESIKDYVRIHLTTESVMTKDSITAFENKLPAHFLRVHRSYIVNASKITAFTKIDIEIEEREIPIGASYKEAVIKFLRES
ncbi:MAG: LytTR family DNA-binding domain-containing protein [Bacteroidota bacterium]